LNASFDTPISFGYSDSGASLSYQERIGSAFFRIRVEAERGVTAAMKETFQSSCQDSGLIHPLEMNEKDSFFH
jgi:hypothetical protein